MSEIDARDIGRLEARLDHVEQELGQMGKDVRQIRDVMMRAQGSWKTLVMLAGVSATVGAAITKIVTWLQGI